MCHPDVLDSLDILVLGQMQLGELNAMVSLELIHILSLLPIHQFSPCTEDLPNL